MISRRPKGGRRRVVVLSLVALFFFYLLLSFLLGERGLVKDIRLRQERSALKKDVEELRQSNKELTRQVEMLKDDPEHIEGLAREQGLVKEGEIIYQYEKE